ncbi:3'-5' exonuclease [Alkalimarinus coralli]|uniref:3'-5' exonuclease n=1 Tax=Alkalimarinus coralli TaxID=2935863 RepID=UPI00202AE6D3|nr:3'-5' exonuclease [Alkalimarinus coralli]
MKASNFEQPVSSAHLDNINSSWPDYYDHQAVISKDERLQRFYQAGVATPETIIANTPMVAMDFETTGLSVEEDEIVSIGVVPFSLQRIFCRESRHWLVKPANKLQESSVVIHGITHSDINTAPDLELILEEILKLLASKLVVVHYRFIEREFLARALLRRLGESIAFPVIDTMDLEQRILVKNQRLIDRVLGKPLGSLRLGDCRTRYGLPQYQAHHALTDALATAELFQAQVAHFFTPDTPVKELWY